MAAAYKKGHHKLCPEKTENKEKIGKGRQLTLYRSVGNVLAGEAAKETALPLDYGNNVGETHQAIVEETVVPLNPQPATRKTVKSAHSSSLLSLATKEVDTAHELDLATDIRREINKRILEMNNGQKLIRGRPPHSHACPKARDWSARQVRRPPS